MTQTRADLYRDTVKHIRVIRNVAKGHKEALGIAEIDMQAMTPYERGRMTRSCQRVGRNLTDLCRDHGQHKMVFFFHAFVGAMGVNAAAFSKAGAIDWSSLYRNSEMVLDNQEVDPSLLPSMLEHIGTMLDEPLAKCPRRLALMRLAIL